MQRKRKHQRKEDKKQHLSVDYLLITKWEILRYLRETDYFLTEQTIGIIARGRKHSEYRITLLAVCSELYHISRLFYRSNSGITKLDAQRYEKELFEGYAENKEEIFEILKRKIKDIEITEQLVDYVWNCLGVIKKIWCHMISRTSEQCRIYLLAYTVDYVLEKEGNVPMPEYRDTWSLFPSNYDDFYYGESELSEYFSSLLRP